MTDKIIRPSATFEKFELEFQNGETERIWVDRDRPADVYVAAVFFRGGPDALVLVADAVGEQLLYDDERDILMVRTSFILKTESRENVIRGLRKREEIVARALADGTAHDPLSDDYIDRRQKEWGKS